MSSTTTTTAPTAPTGTTPAASAPVTPPPTIVNKGIPKGVAWVFGSLVVLLPLGIIIYNLIFPSPTQSAEPASSGLDFTYWALIVLALVLWTLPSLTKKVPEGIKWVGILLLGVLMIFGAEAPKVTRTLQTDAARLVTGGNADTRPTVPPAQPPRLLPGERDTAMAVSWTDLESARFTNNGERRCPITRIDQVSHAALLARLGSEPNDQFSWGAAGGNLKVTPTNELRNAVATLNPNGVILYLVPMPCP